MWRISVSRESAAVAMDLRRCYAEKSAAVTMNLRCCYAENPPLWLRTCSVTMLKIRRRGCEIAARLCLKFTVKLSQRIIMQINVRRFRRGIFKDRTPRRSVLFFCYRYFYGLNMICSVFKTFFKRLPCKAYPTAKPCIYCQNFSLLFNNTLSPHRGNPDRADTP